MHVGRKVLVPVLMTEKLLDRIDAVARRDAPPDKDPNRSEAIRKLVRAALDVDEATRRAAESDSTRLASRS